MDVSRFLERIGCAAIDKVDLETLKHLQRAFLLSVPFENLDIHFDDKTVLSFDAFYEKIVDHHRGGISYECNGLFFAMLRAIGFDVQLLSARLCIGEALTPDFDHMLLLVSVPGDVSEHKYLVDVGLGQSCAEPIMLGSDEICMSQGYEYRLGVWQGLSALFYRSAKGDWQPRLAFTLDTKVLSDFAPMYRFHQNSEESPFTQGQLVTMLTDNGRITLNGMSLIVTDGDTSEQRELCSEQQYRDCLKNCFGIEFDT